MAIPRNLANIAPHVNASSTELVVNDGGANLDFRVEGDGNANLIVADAGVDKVGIGTNTFNTNGGVLQVSNGISFPASQSACADLNTLDDYEEGTWTPSDQSGASLTFTVAYAEYTKVGRVITVNFEMTFPSTVNGSNAAISLPITPASANRSGMRIFSNTAGGVNYYLNGNGNFFVLYNDSGVQITNAVMSTKYLIVSFSYFV